MNFVFLFVSEYIRKLSIMTVMVPFIYLLFGFSQPDTSVFNLKKENPLLDCLWANLGYFLD